MFFKKLFRKDHNHYRERGETLLAEDRYADARHAFTEARALIAASTPDAATLDAHLASRIALTENKLCELNLAEGAHSLAQGEVSRAEDHFLLAKELAHDPLIREKAETLLRSCREPVPDTPPLKKSHSCGGCGEPTPAAQAVAQTDDMLLSDSDRFQLLTHPLPGDLPSRYLLLGDRFACAYLLAHDGDGEAALKIYEELLAVHRDDVVLYEKSLILHGNEDMVGCEHCLREAYGINPLNPLVCLGIAQLLMGIERYEEALTTLEHMIAHHLLQDSAMLLKGDTFQLIGDTDQALGVYSQLLSHPAAAKSAAGRMTELLDKLGRQQEAEFIFKRHLKGCC